MPGIQPTGKALRLTRLSRHDDGRFLFIPLDHSVADGPIATAAGFARLVRDLSDGGADAIIVHKGRARMIEPRLLTRCALVLQLSASTAHAPDADAKVLVADVEEAVRLGADAVTVHVNIGSDTEAAQLADLGSVAGACDRWGIPLLAMIYPRGPRITDPADPVLLAHAAGIAADLGADIVKTPLAMPALRMREVVASSPLPVIVAGGAGDHCALPELAAAALSAGCSGLAAGRRVFTSPSPREAVSRLAAIVHGGALPAGQATIERVAGRYETGLDRRPLPGPRPAHGRH